MIRLRELRQQAGLKQDELANAIGKSLPNYNKKENGEVRISLIEAKIIADFFQQPIEAIFFANEVSKKETRE